ncbi:DUF3179 domain-containing protein [uncultured Mycolicibacterium sp.]|uniref:DUF3179 domain-containing protein n=1 Tax=uncultured Mycolicibacterium sp. TaxID=2320817 RepID=UPI0032B2A0AD
MDRDTPPAPSRRHVLVGAGVVIGGATAAAVGVQWWRGAQPGPAPNEPPDTELDALAAATLSGGPGPDGIPPIDAPRFVTADKADFLHDADPVFGLVHRGEVRAYPQQILVWHEIVNDTVGGEPLSVTYCPLTGTAIAYLSPPGDVRTFGTTGRLVNSNLLMYDRATESQWPQILGVAISGPLKGTRLDTVPLVWTTWRAWRTVHPNTLMLSTDTGALRDYGRDPYGSYLSATGYYFEDDTLFPVRHVSDRYGNKEVVVGVRDGSDRFAVLKDRVRRDRSVTIGPTGKLVAEWDDRLDAAVVRRADTAAPADFMDAMWFAWHAFYPQAQVW